MCFNYKLIMAQTKIEQGLLNVNKRLNLTSYHFLVLNKKLSTASTTTMLKNAPAPTSVNQCAPTNNLDTGAIAPKLYTPTLDHGFLNCFAIACAMVTDSVVWPEGKE